MTPTYLASDLQDLRWRSDAHMPDDLQAGPMKPVTKPAMITGGAIYPRAAVMGQIATDGRYTLATAAADDGSQTPCALLVDTADTTSGDVPGAVYVMGEYNIERVSLGEGITLDMAVAALEDRGVYLRRRSGSANW